METLDYKSVWETLGIDATQKLDLGATIPSPVNEDWRDTLRDSLPRLPVGSANDSHFRLAKVLGQGGMGIVHLAHQKALGRDVAVKTVHDGVVSREVENALLQEARAMGLVEHPNVVPVYVIGQDENGKPVIVMKRIDGTSWLDFLTGQTEVPGDPIEFHIRVAVAICNALAFAHSRGVLHRDVKPDNVMIGKFGEIYLLDWGLAVSMDPSSERIPYVLGADDVVGTPVYMAPEMTIGEGSALGFHTDIFLVGAVLYHCFTGAPPNYGDTLFDVLRCSYEGRERAYPDDVPAELVDLCEKAMAHDVESRFNSVDALRIALEEFQEHQNSHQLVATARRSLAALESAVQEKSNDEVHQYFGEARFGFLSALQIWPDNEDAQADLQRSLVIMLDYELELENLSGARALLSQMTGDVSALQARVEILEKAVASREARLGKIAYDYDETIGLAQRRVAVGVMAVGFLLGPILSRFMEQGVPPQLQWAGTEPMMATGNLISLMFSSVLLTILGLTYRIARDHMASRVFAMSLSIMYMIGVTIRTSTVWAEVPNHIANAAEASVYAASLAVLGIALDRRVFPGSVCFAIVGPIILLNPDWSTDAFGLASFAAAVSFVFYERINPRYRMQQREARKEA